MLVLNNLYGLILALKRLGRVHPLTHAHAPGHLLLHGTHLVGLCESMSEEQQ